VREFNHPYADFEPGYEGFRTTRFTHPPHSAACIPYAWMLRSKVEGEAEGEVGLAERFGVDYDVNREPELRMRDQR
jgi:hypothetical protein